MGDSRAHSKPPSGPKFAQWQGQSLQLHQYPMAHQRQQQATPPPVANYTLPGVINYLTSEFTNLERFKIMTNLERSEMKYKIVDLEGQINSLKYINEHQKVRIAELERELQEQKSTSDSPETRNFTAGSSGQSKTQHIPHVDLDIIREARNQLTVSMREVVQLLKAPVPSNGSYLNLPETGEGENEFEELFDNGDDLAGRLDEFTFADQLAQKAKPSVFSHYLEDIPLKKPPMEKQEQLKDTQVTDLKTVSHKPKLPGDRKLPASKSEPESDVETVTFEDEPSDQRISLIQSVHVPESARSFFCDNGELVVSIISNEDSPSINITTVDEQPTISFPELPPASPIVDFFNISSNNRRFLFVLENGVVIQTVLDQTAVLERTSFTKGADDFDRVISADIAIGTENSLVVNGISKSVPTLNTYAVSSEESVSQKTYDRDFFATIPAGATHSFEAVHWVEKSLVFRLDQSIVKLDPSTGIYKELYNSENYAYGVHTRNYFDGNVMLVPEYSASTLDLCLLDCHKEQVLSPKISWSVRKPESVQLAVVASADGFVVAKLADDSLQVYDQNLELIASTTASGNLRRIGSRVVVANGNYNFYDIK